MGVIFLPNYYCKTFKLKQDFLQKLCKGSIFLSCAKCNAKAKNTPPVSSSSVIEKKLNTLSTIYWKANALLQTPEECLCQYGVRPWARSQAGLNGPSKPNEPQILRGCNFLNIRMLKVYSYLVKW